MESEQEQGGRDFSKVAGSVAHIAQRHIVGGDVSIAPPVLGNSIGEIA